MPLKSRRIVRSSSVGNTTVFNQVRPIESQTARWEKCEVQVPSVAAKPAQASTKKLKPSVAKSDFSRRSILTLASPIRDTSNESSEMRFDGQIGGFLEACHSCKKKIGEKDAIFMYGYLSAFCSPECRDKQISLDKVLGKTSGDAEEMNMVESKWILKLGKGAAS